MPGEELQRRVAYHVKACRQTMQLTQEQLGEMIGRHPKYIGNIEQGKRNLTLKSLERLADDLRVDPADLQLPVPVTAPPPGKRWPRPHLRRTRPAAGTSDGTTAPADDHWTISFTEDADDALAATLAALSRLEVVVSFGCRDGTVVDGVPLTAFASQVRCLGWDPAGELATEDTFILAVDQIATVQVR